MAGSVLIPLDFTPASEQALAWAAAYAQRVGKRLEVLHVVPRPHQLDPFFTPGSVPSRTVEIITERAARRLAKLMRGCRVPYRLSVAEGDPTVHILRAARQCGADLIVLGTHARGGIARFMLGTVAAQVLRAAEVPVLTLRVATSS